HTRSKRDWSSDVCSSDLGLTFGQIATGTYNFGVTATSCTGTLAPTSKCTIDIVFGPTAAGPYADTLYISDNASGSPQLVALSGEIGRASCRERVCGAGLD